LKSTAIDTITSQSNYSEQDINIQQAVTDALER